MTEAEIILYLVTDLGENLLSTCNNPSVLTAYTSGDSHKIWMTTHVRVDVDSHSQNKQVFVLFGSFISKKIIYRKKIFRACNKFEVIINSY